MKTKPCKHLKEWRHINLQLDVTKNDIPNGIGFYRCDILTTYCAYCGKKIREVEVEQ